MKHACVKESDGENKKRKVNRFFLAVLRRTKHFRRMEFISFFFFLQLNSLVRFKSSRTFSFRRHYDTNIRLRTGVHFRFYCLPLPHSRNFWKFCESSFPHKKKNLKKSHQVYLHVLSISYFLYIS